MKKIYEIASIKYDWLVSKIEELNKKCKKLNCSFITIKLLNTSSKKGFINVEIEGEIPKINGWSFVGVIDYLYADDGQVKTIIKSIPNCDIPKQYRDKPQNCDHCHVNRYRTKTYIVRNEQSNYRQVGSSCLKDFLGHNSPHLFARQAEIILSIEDLFVCLDDGINSFGGGHRYRYVHDLEDYLAVVSATIRKYGWLSKTKIKEELLDAVPTSSVAFGIWSDKDDRIQAERDGFEVNDSDVKIAIDSIQWAKDLSDSDEDLSDYEHNVNVIATLGYFESYATGYAASIIPAYQRWLRQQEVKNRPPVNSQFVGEIGKRSEFKVKVNNIIMKEGHYGLTCIHLMEDTDGNKLVWFASQTKLVDEEDHDFHIVKATVKQHNERFDSYLNQVVNQTVVNRVKLV